MRRDGAGAPLRVALAVAICAGVAAGLGSDAEDALAQLCEQNPGADMCLENGCTGTGFSGPSAEMCKDKLLWDLRRLDAEALARAYGHYGDSCSTSYDDCIAAVNAAPSCTCWDPDSDTDPCEDTVMWKGVLCDEDEPMSWELWGPSPRPALPPRFVLARPLAVLRFSFVMV